MLSLVLLRFHKKQLLYSLEYLLCYRSIIKEKSKFLCKFHDYNKFYDKFPRNYSLAVYKNRSNIELIMTVYKDNVCN